MGICTDFRKFELIHRKRNNLKKNNDKYMYIYGIMVILIDLFCVLAVYSYITTCVINIYYIYILTTYFNLIPNILAILIIAIIPIFFSS